MGTRIEAGRHTNFESNDNVKISKEVSQAAQPLLLGNGNTGMQPRADDKNYGHSTPDAPLCNFLLLVLLAACPVSDVLLSAKELGFREACGPKQKQPLNFSNRRNRTVTIPSWRKNELKLHWVFGSVFAGESSDHQSNRRRSLRCRGSMLLPGVGPVTTNFLNAGALSNQTVRFYRMLSNRRHMNPPALNSKTGARALHTCFAPSSEGQKWQVQAKPQALAVHLNGRGANGNSRGLYLISS
ncbi:MAG: hypothetical protein ACREDS_16395 [Limisphaerales bacterium]